MISILKTRPTVILLGAILLFLISTRLCHTGILWTDGDYHLAAAIQWHLGKLLYRDLWYDKPPGTALLLLLLGQPTGWLLPVAEASVAWTACLFAFLTARKLGGFRAGALAALLLAFFLTFYIPTAVIPIAPDLLMIAPHLAAVFFAFSRRPWLAGISASLAFWINAKGLFVLLACLAIAPNQAIPILIGFAVPCGLGGIWLALSGAWNGYVEQVWRWSLLYARSTPLVHPWLNGVLRTLRWIGFHAALVVGSICFFRRHSHRRWLPLLVWTALSFLAVAQGMRFLPRYYFQLLAPLAVIAALGFSSLLSAPRLPLRMAVLSVAALCLAIPLVRFGPQYILLALDDLHHRPHQWSDLALDEDDQALAHLLAPRASARDTLFIWGYRPGLYVYTRLHAPSLFWDSQPLTGVPADRHLGSTLSIAPEWARQNREQLASTRPTFVVDALSLSNPALAIDRYPELTRWRSLYHECGRTPLSRIYCLQ